MSDEARRLDELPWNDRTYRAGDKRRSKTQSMKRATQSERAEWAADVRELEREGGPLPERPKTRGECEGGARPCPYVGCRHNLYLDVAPRIGSVTFNFPGLEPEQVLPSSSCSLDVADRGGVQLEVVGGLMNVTRERVRQVEVKAKRRYLARAKAMGLESRLAEGLAAAAERDSGESPLASAMEPSGGAGGVYLRGPAESADEPEDDDARRKVPRLPRIGDARYDDGQYAEAVYGLLLSREAYRRRALDGEFVEVGGVVISREAAAVLEVVRTSWALAGQQPTYEAIGMWSGVRPDWEWASRRTAIGNALSSLRAAGVLVGKRSDLRLAPPPPEAAQTAPPPAEPPPPPDPGGAPRSAKLARESRAAPAPRPKRRARPRPVPPPAPPKPAPRPRSARNPGSGGLGGGLFDEGFARVFGAPARKN